MLYGGCGQSPKNGQYRWTLNPSNTAEVNFSLREGELASLTFSASAPVRWDQHWHDGARTLVVQTGEDTQKTVSVAGQRGPLTSVYFTHPGSPRGAIELQVFASPASAVHSVLP